MLDTIATTLLPVAFVIFLGNLAGRRHFFGAPDRALLTRLMMTWLLPPLLLAGILQTPRADLMNYQTPLLFVVGLMVPFLIALFGCLFLMRYDLRTSTLRASLFACPDMVFMGIPILNQVFGPASLLPLLIANLVPTIVLTPLTSVLLDIGTAEEKRGSAAVFAKAFLKAVCEPRVWAPFIGIVLLVLDAPMPSFVIKSLNLIGSATTGISLFVVGLITAEEKVRLTPAVWVNTFAKNLVHPCAMLVIALALHVSGTLGQEAVLLAALPSAVIATMFAGEYGILEAESSTTILTTRVLAFATIPFMIALTSHVFAG
jgi:malonate transporter